MNNKKSTKIVAIIALLGIFLSIVTTAILVIYDNYGPQTQQLTPEQLQELFQNYEFSEESLNLNTDNLENSMEDNLPQDLENN